MVKSIAEIWPVFIDKALIFDRTGNEPCQQDITIGEMLDAALADPDGFIELLKTADEFGIWVLQPFFDYFADLPDGQGWLRKIKAAIEGRASKEDMDDLEKLIK